LRRQHFIKWTCGIVLVLFFVALDLYSYHLHELLVSLALFSVAFLLLALIVLAAILLWWASENLARKTGPASRRVIAFTRRLIASYARP
jgi:hypothetical protein